MFSKEKPVKHNIKLYYNYIVFIVLRYNRNTIITKLLYKILSNLEGTIKHQIKSHIRLI